MSAAIKTNRIRKLSISAPALWLVLGLAAAFFLVRYGQEVLQEHDLNGKVVAQQRLNAQMDQENKRLQASLEYYLSDKYIEQRAREDLNLRRADEEVLIPIGDPMGGTIDGSPQTVDGGRPVEEGDGSEKANWQKWFDLFSPFRGSP
jgi:cell division protein FtsB